MDINGDNIAEFTGQKKLSNNSRDMGMGHNAVQTHQTKTLDQWNKELSGLTPVPAPQNTVEFKVTTQKRQPQPDVQNSHSN